MYKDDLLSIKQMLEVKTPIIIMIKVDKYDEPWLVFTFDDNASIEISLEFSDAIIMANNE